MYLKARIFRGVDFLLSLNIFRQHRRDTQERVNSYTEDEFDMLSVICLRWNGFDASCRILSGWGSLCRFQSVNAKIHDIKKSCVTQILSCSRWFQQCTPHITIPHYFHQDALPTISHVSHRSILCAHTTVVWTKSLMLLFHNCVKLSAIQSDSQTGQ